MINVHVQVSSNLNDAVLMITINGIKNKMKKILLILSVLILMLSCGDVKDNNGGNYDIVIIEGCKFYRTNYALAKVNCNCVPSR